MSARKSLIIVLTLTLCATPLLAFSANTTPTPSEPKKSLFSSLFAQSAPNDTIAKQLGWVQSNENYCGGYYLEQPFIYPGDPNNDDLVGVTSEQSLFSQRGTSVLEGKVTVNRAGQQITANKAYLYRDPVTGKLNAIDLIGDVHLREPNTLIISKKGHYNFQAKTKSLIDILYRTSISSKLVEKPKISPEEAQTERKVPGLSAWGKAYEFSQTEPHVYEFSRASYTTCPPIDPAWRLKASHIELDRESGRGVATHVRILVKEVPVFYTPYINFPIDSRRKSGFLYPTLGGNNNWGPYILTPVYWNMAPNYDMTFTPGILMKRGIQLTDNFRYLTSTSEGHINFSILPNDKFFADFQRKARENPQSIEPANQPASITDAEINRLLGDSTTRRAFSWRDKSRYSDHWSSYVDFNYAGDDYYLRDFGSSLNEITENQLLQEGNLYYKDEHWNFTGRVQAYQTLHPVDSNPVLNQYRRFPQLILNGDYPDQPLGLEYFINNEVTHFEMLKTPGSDLAPPLGNRLHTQPGISLPLSWPYFFINPRLQLALTDYNLYQTTQTKTPNSKRRALPIFDIASGLSFNRDVTLFNYAFQQTLEPQVYYTYIPYRNQASIPVFDTTVNMLNYEQLFNYNRFSGLDRIGDANQLAAGVTTRLIDQQSGFEKVRLGVGGITYFATRRVTLCNNPSVCTDYPENRTNLQRLSPLTGSLRYFVNPFWNVGGNVLWNPITKQVDSSTILFHYEPVEKHIINLGYNFVRNGDYFTGITTNTAQNNLKLTDISFEWPVIRDISSVGRWSHDWNTNHFQNLLFGLQYDTCCWAVRAVGERAFTKLGPNGTPKYNSGYYLQFALKGLGNIGTRDPSTLLAKNITGYRTQFGQEF